MGGAMGRSHQTLKFYHDNMRAWRKRRVLAFLIVAAGLGLVPAYMRAYVLTGASEIPTILVGDKFVVNTAAYSLKLPYSRTRLFRTGLPKRGDFVYLYLPKKPQLRPGFVKRIIGLPGETVELRDNLVLIDGLALPVRVLNPAEFLFVPKAHPIGSVVEDEDGHWITFTPGNSRYRNYPPTRLADGQCFLLGDNRDDSDDSREFGPVPESLLLGKVIAIFPAGQRAK
jgi:signal peptidase I